MSSHVTTAFVLGAGLGTRLRPLTESLPKPLIPLWGQPLIAHAFAHLASAGVERFMINTHWHPEAYAEAFSGGLWKDRPLSFRHEPVLLETAGGIANVADWLGREGSFWVYNGDILSTIPLEPALAAHAASKNIATLILRTSGAEKVVAFDEEAGRIRDIRDLLGTGLAPTHQFTGLYLCRPEFLDWLTPGKIESSRAIFLEIVRRADALGGVVIDDGLWMDLGDRASYLAAHRALPAPEGWGEARPGVTQRGMCAIAPGAVVEAGAELEDCVVWAGGRVTADARLTRCVVRGGSVAGGTAVDRDF